MCDSQRPRGCRSLVIHETHSESCWKPVWTNSCFSLNVNLHRLKDGIWQTIFDELGRTPCDIFENKTVSKEYKHKYYLTNHKTCFFDFLSSSPRLSPVHPPQLNSETNCCSKVNGSIRSSHRLRSDTPSRWRHTHLRMTSLWSVPACKQVSGWTSLLWSLPRYDIWLCISFGRLLYAKVCFLFE